MPRAQPLRFRARACRRAGVENRDRDLDAWSNRARPFRITLVVNVRNDVAERAESRHGNLALGRFDLAADDRDVQPLRGRELFELLLIDLTARQCRKALRHSPLDRCIAQAHAPYECLAREEEISFGAREVELRLLVRRLLVLEIE